MANLYEQVGTCDYNDIFASATPTAHTQTVEIAASQGVLKRGSLLVGPVGGEFKLCSKSAASGETGFVLAEDVDTGTGDAVCATAYATGHFRRDALITSGYTLTAKDIDALRGIGILTTDSID